MISRLLLPPSSFSVLAVVALLSAPGVQARDYPVSTQQDYREAVKQLTPGDNIILADGEWRDFDVLFQGQGTERKPISLVAQTPGNVVLTGASSLRLAGKHLVVKGLVFRDGYTPRNAVISFRKDSKHLANNSRVTEVVIDNFSNPERYETDYWVAIYGKNNRFDHNFLSGKGNRGVTMAVRLDAPESRDNHHRIDHNYFGPRPILGSNGGETLRIGTSHYSMFDSNTVVENNYFDRCDGELEIISNKSGGNVFRNNVFYESSGTLTLRHGDGNLLEYNVFFGNNVPHTGGIRVINRQQTVRNNYMEGLSGIGFGSAFTIMNGVPNSPVNRYHQVDQAVVTNNTIVNSGPVLLGGGSDAERSAVPINSQFTSNLVYREDGEPAFAVLDDMSGITFSDNLVSVNSAIPGSKGSHSVPTGLERADNGLLYPSGETSVGAARSLSPLSREAAGPTWYPKPPLSAGYPESGITHVKADADALVDAVANAPEGAVLELAAGTYEMDKILYVSKAITVRAKGGAQPERAADRVVLTFSRSSLFQINEGGSLRLQGLTILGDDSPDSSGNSVIRTGPYSMLGTYNLLVDDCEIANLDTNRYFSFFRAAKNTFAHTIEIRNSRFKSVNGTLIQLDEEDDDDGRYNAEYVNLIDSEFEDIQGPVVALYRGGTDESTFGPHFELRGSTLNNIGHGSKNKTGASIYLHGVQDTLINANTVTGSAPVVVEHTVGSPDSELSGNTFNLAPEVRMVIKENPVPAVLVDNVIQ